MLDVPVGEFSSEATGGRDKGVPGDLAPVSPAHPLHRHINSAQQRERMQIHYSSMQSLTYYSITKLMHNTELVVY